MTSTRKDHKRNLYIFSHSQVALHNRKLDTESLITPSLDSCHHMDLAAAWQKGLAAIQYSI